MILPKRLKINSNSTRCHKIWSKVTRTELEMIQNILNIFYYIINVIYYILSIIDQTKYIILNI